MSDYPSQDTRVEPDTQADTDDGHSLHSLAISAKRQADALERIASVLETNSSFGNFDVMMRQQS